MKKYPIGKFVYEFECNRDLVQDVLDSIKNNYKNYHWFLNGPNEFKNTRIGYVDPDDTVPFYHEKLFSWFYDCLKEVADDNFYPEVQLEICDAWIHHMVAGQASTHIHEHGGSIFSGLLYLTSHEKTVTNFYVPADGPIMMGNILNFGKMPPALNWQKTMNVFKSAPKAGKLLIFPSDIPHNVDIHKDIKKERYSVAFNSFPTGRLPGIATGHLDIKTISVEEKYKNYMENKNDTMG